MPCTTYYGLNFNFQQKDLIPKSTLYLRGRSSKMLKQIEGRGCYCSFMVSIFQRYLKLFPILSGTSFPPSHHPFGPQKCLLSGADFRTNKMGLKREGAAGPNSPFSLPQTHVCPAWSGSVITSTQKKTKTQFFFIQISIEAFRKGGQEINITGHPRQNMKLNYYLSALQLLPRKF